MLFEKIQVGEGLSSFKKCELIFKRVTIKCTLSTEDPSYEKCRNSIRAECPCKEGSLPAGPETLMP